MEHMPSDGLAERFESVVAWLEGLGIRTDQGRIRTIRGDLQEILATAGGPGWGALAAEERLWRAVHSMKEAADLWRIFKHYRGRGEDSLKARLRHLPSGPEPGADEATSNTLAKDVLAELSWGALLEGSGFSTTIDFRTDVIEHHRLVGETIGIAYEVKRPRSLAGLGDAMAKARDQIADAVQGRMPVGPHKVGFGCIVLVLDHLLPPTLPHLAAAEPNAETHRILYQTVETWRLENGNALNRGSAAHVAGYFLWWRPIGRLRSATGQFHPTEIHQVNLERFPGRVDWSHVLVNERRNRVRAIN